LKNLRLGDAVQGLMDREVVIRTSKGETAGVRNIPLNPTATWAFTRLVERANLLGSVDPEHYLFPRSNSRQTKTAVRILGYDPTQHQKSWKPILAGLTTPTSDRE
jgi:hypothetical protein